VRFFGSRRTSRTSGPRADDVDVDLSSTDLEAVLLAGGVGRVTGARPSPVTRERVSAWMDACGFTYFVDSDGDLGGLWHGRLFYFLVLGDEGEVLQVRGQWHREASIERLGEILELCNAWNADHIWPKTYARVRDDGAVVVCAEVTVSLEHGASDTQLGQLLHCGLSTGAMFFEQLDQYFVDPLRTTP
jgi:hypothetical protein